MTPRGVLRLTPVLEGSSAALFAQIGAAGGEGLISKRRDAPYRAGRSASWVKTEVERRGAFVIMGFQHSTSRGRAFASLLLAAQQDGALVYRGKVGTGFDAATEADLRARLTSLTRQTPPLADPPTLRAKVTWVTPKPHRRSALRRDYPRRPSAPREFHCPAGG